MKESSFFGGTAYLSIPHNEKFRKLVFEGIEHYGTNYGASRNNNSTLDIFSIAEEEAAKRSGGESAIIVSSGYLAAQLVIQYYLGDYKYIYAPDTHPALWIGRPKPPQINFDKWAEETVSAVNSSDEPVLIITNSVNNLFPEIYQFHWLNKILPGKRVILLVDDSHGIGITGKYGEGVYSRIPKLPHIETIVIASMAKALGVDAGLIMAPIRITDDLRSSPVYAGASPPSPGALYAYINSSEIYSEELQKLRYNMALFTSLLRSQSGINYITGFPVFLIDDPGAGDYLASERMIISSFAYPDPKGRPLNRVVLNSSHNEEELRKLAGVLTERIGIKTDAHEPGEL